MDIVINYDEFYDRPLKEPKESPKQFARYMVYRNMDKLERSVRRATELVNEKGDDVAEHTLQNTAHKFKWAERAKAYDTFLATIEIEVLETTLAEAVEYVTNQEDLELVMATRLMQRVLRNVTEAAGSDNVEKHPSLQDVHRMLNSLDKLHTLRRRRAGMPTNFVTKEAEDQNLEEQTYIIGAN